MKEYLRKLLLRYRSPGIIVDANLLLLLLVGDLNRDRIVEFRPTKNRFVAADYDRLQEILAPVERFVVTPHILTEVSNFLGQASSSQETYALRSILDQNLSQFDIQDISISTLVNPTDLEEFRKYGLTDAVIIQLARKGYLAVTVDFPLSQYIQSLDREVFNYTTANCISIPEAKWR